MKLFIDTANLEEIKAAEAMGVISGVTTNPSLIAQEGRNFKQVVEEIASVVDGPISAEVISLELDGMLEEARELVKIHRNIVIKLPLTAEGLKAIKILSKEGIKTNATLVFSANQAILAAEAGATYVSPFVGRVDDTGTDGMILINDLCKIFKQAEYETKIIVASVRSPLHVVEAAKLGADIATVPFKVIKQMIYHPQTDLGLEKFLRDWETVRDK